MIDRKKFCGALGRFATGVTVITAQTSDGQPIGVTVSAFSSLSLEPPLVLACLGKATTSLEAFSQGTHFTVNILSREQLALSENFARRAADKFGGVTFRVGDNGCPVLMGSLAVIECRRHAVHDGGDHLVLIGEVERIETSADDGGPLLHYRGAYHALGAPL